MADVGGRVVRDHDRTVDRPRWGILEDHLLRILPVMTIVGFRM
jgi:hypothetical protein